MVTIKKELEKKLKRISEIQCVYWEGVIQTLLTSNIITSTSSGYRSVKIPYEDIYFEVKNGKMSLVIKK